MYFVRRFNLILIFVILISGNYILRILVGGKDFKKISITLTIIEGE